MRSGICLMVAAFAVWLGWSEPAAACSCVIPDLNRSFDNADHVLHVRVVSPLLAASGERRYLAVTVGESFKGCLGARSWVVLSTPGDSAACGAIFERGTEHLVYGSDGGKSRFGMQVIRTGLCSGNSPWDEVSDAELQFLNTRFVCCGDECACNGSEQVACLVDPCSVSTCAVEGAMCRSNYCGGCNAEWVDASGALVCEPEDVCDDPDRAYVATSPEACATVRFLCEEGREAFFDDCGCGCVVQRATVVEPCRLGGCSSQLCLGPEDEDVVTTCEFRPEYACYRTATCEPQSDGACGWTPTDELKACIEAAQMSSPPPTP